MVKKSDLEGIPDVDLGQVKAEVEQQQKEEAQEQNLDQFKSVDDLLKSYKEIQGAFTKTAQENKDLKKFAEEAEQLKAEIAALREQQELSRLQSAPQQANRSFDESWMQDPEMTIEQKVEQKLNQTRIQEVMDEEYLNNPEEFQERYQWADYLARNPNYQNLSKTPAGVKRLFKMADNLRVENLKKSSKKALQHIFGEDLDEEKLANLKSLITGNKQTNSNSNAYMPDGSTSTRSRADADSGPDINRKISDSANKGDVDGVLDAIFNDILA